MILNNQSTPYRWIILKPRPSGPQESLDCDDPMSSPAPNQTLQDLTILSLQVHTLSDTHSNTHTQSPTQLTHSTLSDTLFQTPPSMFQNVDVDREAEEALVTVPEHV